MLETELKIFDDYEDETDAIRFARASNTLVIILPDKTQLVVGLDEVHEFIHFLKEQEVAMIRENDEHQRLQQQEEAKIPVSIMDTFLSSHVKNALTVANINTLDDLAKVSVKSLMKDPNMGDAMVIEILDFAEKSGTTLKTGWITE